MKKSVRNALLFLLGLLAISFIIQIFFFSLIKNLRVGELGVINKIAAGEINADILVCGASRSFVGINPEIIEDSTGMSCYNISLNGSRLGVQLPVLKQYLKYNIKPKIIIQEVGMYSLSDDDKIFAPYKYLPYLDEDILYDGLKEIDDHLCLNKYFPIFNLPYFNTDLQKLLIKDYYLQFFKKRDNLIKGFHPNTSVWSISEEAFYKAPYGVINRIEEKAISDLLQIISICDKENITLILVNTPEYFKILPYYKYRDEKIKYFNELVRLHSICFLDYSFNDIGRNKNYFYNFTHLNSKGAFKFSRLLASNILKIRSNN